jgi:hypothetical protein
MDYALPSGVVNTDSVYYFADTTLALGPLVKQISDQTLVIVDFSHVTPPHTVTGYDFSIDVSSNPALVVSYPQLDVAGDILTFLVSGGIVGQQYNISLTTNVDINARTDILTINIPSAAGDCTPINPVPSIYTQLPLGEPTQGYVNSAVRYFWGAAAPMNPNVMDQWYDPTADTLYEWVTNGTDFFWQIIMSDNLVPEAPLNTIIYGRYNGAWVAAPIQSDAPADGTQYVRRNNSWFSLPQYVTEAPGGGIRYGRYNGVWQADAIQLDAPSNGNTYGRNNGGWTALPPYIVEAPMTGLLYSRSNSNWLVTPIQSDAPADGQFYARNNRAWLPIDILNLLTDAPSDGTLYGRQDGAWAAAYPASNPANYTTAAQLATATALLMPRQGGTFTGAISVPGFIVPNGPQSMQIGGGGQPGQVLAANNTSSTLTWAAPGTPEAPLDGIAYARQNGVWVPTAAGAGVPEAPSDGTTYSRKSATWVHLTHTDITDWTATLAPYALISQIPLGSIIFPLMDGTNAIGTSTNWARADHVHPTDTSRYSASNPAGYQTAAQVTAALAPYALITSVPIASNAAPTMNGAVAPGSSPAFSRADHIHPTDTSRAPASALGNYVLLAGSTMTGLLTLVGNPVGNLDATPKQYVDTSLANAIIDCGTY